MVAETTVNTRPVNILVFLLGEIAVLLVWEAVLLVEIIVPLKS
jgi:hypothetical protein